jgi:heat shock protein HslJ
MTMKAVKLSVVIFVLALTACQSKSQLAGTSWRLVSYGDVNNPVLATKDKAPTLEFLPDGKLNANTGCNSAGGDYKIEGNKLTITNLVSTLSACAEPERANQEAAFVAGLNKAETFKLENDTLVIHYENNTKALTCIRHS